MSQISARPISLLVLIVLLAGIAASVAPTPAQPLAPTPTPLPLFALPSASTYRAFTSSSIAVRPDDTRIVAAVNPLSASVTFANPALGRVLGEYAVAPDPRGVAFTLDGTRALVVSRADSLVTIFDTARALAPVRGVDPVIARLALDGIWAYAIVADNTRAYVSLMGSDAIAEIDLTGQTVTRLIPTPDAPAGLMLWGDFLYVTHFWSGELSLIYLPRGAVIATVPTGADAALFQAIAPDITRGIAYLPATRLNVAAPDRVYDSAALPVVNVIDLRSLTMLPGQRIALNEIDRPVNLPLAVALDRFAQRLYVASSGSAVVSVIDLNTGRARAQIPVGSGPRGLALNADNSRLYVHNLLENSITTVSTARLEIEDTLVLSTQLRVSADVLLGMQLFHSAADPRLSTDSGLSCATCHFDGMSDGRVWSAYPTDSGIAARNTPLLYALPETVPYTWSGAWDELADIEVKIRGLMAGTGLVEDPLAAAGRAATFHTGLSPDLDVLTAYLLALDAPPSAPPQDPARVARGAQVFAEQRCATCHVGTVGTNLQQVDVGTGGRYDVPSLRWLWLSAPYFHDGRAATLRQVFELEGAHNLLGLVSPDDLDALTAYLLAWTDAPPVP
jgi:YVTN family beta-propeller protein